MRGRKGERRADPVGPPVPAPQVISAEANLLKLPLFALDAKSLRTLEGFRCTGEARRDGKTHRFELRTSRNTATPYPGPLSRAVHLALLGIVRESGLPFANPVTWGWRDLCRRMGKSYYGHKVAELKGAIRATCGLMIESRSAFYSKPDGRLIDTREQLLHLYQDVAFRGQALPDGGTADSNQLWLSPWYLANLNALYAVPLDHAVWRSLDDRSSVASRLYEFLLVKLDAGRGPLRINYETLVQFLPLTPRGRFSWARRQLDPALALLKGEGVLADVSWERKPGTLAQLRLAAGPRLVPARGTETSPREEAEAFQFREVHDADSPGTKLVADFYRLWADGPTPDPTRKELDQAEELTRHYGAERALALLPRVTDRLREKWPEAKRFAAAVKYFPEVARQAEEGERRHVRREQELQRLREERRQSQDRRDRQQALSRTWGPVWESLPAGEKDTLRQDVLRDHPLYAELPESLDQRCLQLLAARAPRCNLLQPRGLGTSGGVQPGLVRTQHPLHRRAKSGPSTGC